MPLTKAIEVKVIGNVLEEFQKLRSERIVYISYPKKVDKENPVCPICQEKMTSPFGIYNGSSDCDDEGKFSRHWSFECSNFHNCSWTE